MGSSDASSGSAAGAVPGEGNNVRGSLQIEGDGFEATEGGVCGRRAGRVGGFLSGFGFRVFDNMSFVGEVLVDWLELDKPKYHHEIQQMRKQRRRQIREKQRQEAAQIASVEEATAPGGSANEQDGLLAKS